MAPTTPFVSLNTPFSDEFSTPYFHTQKATSEPKLLNHSLSLENPSKMKHDVVKFACRLSTSSVENGFSKTIWLHSTEPLWNGG